MTKRKKRSVVTNIPRPFTRLNDKLKKLGPTGGIVLVFIMLLVGIVGAREVKTFQERSTFKAAEKQISNFVDEAAKLAPSTRKIAKECRYSSAKLGKGPLGCSIYGKVRYEGLAEMDKLISVGKTLIPSKWQYIRDNTFNYAYLPKSEIKNSIYEFKGMSCRVSYSYEVDERQQIITIDGRKNLIVMADCTGSALREYYKVVDY